MKSEGRRSKPIVKSEGRNPKAEGPCRIGEPKSETRNEIHQCGFWLFLVTLALSASVCTAATFTVTNTADSGSGSLRQAIITANATPGANLIQFNLPGSGVRTIAPFTQLPDITNTVTIDGYSQSGSSSNSLANANNATLLIRLDGASITNNAFDIGLRINGANNCAVRGLVVVRFYTAIQLNNSSGNTIAGNWIGLDADNVSRGGTGTGVDLTCFVFSRSTGNLIGGTNPWDRNVICGFHTGISITPIPADHNTVQGNFIGTDASGTLPRAIAFTGISVSSATNILIGGSSPGARNVIGACGTGIFLQSSSGHLVQGNLIGTDVSGHYNLGCTSDGMDMQACSFTTIRGNLIGNNAAYGLFLQGCATNTIQGNWIGTDPTGAFVLGNGKDGINLQTSSSTTIGGASVGAPNVIEFNNGVGVNILSGGSNFISANSIFDNAGLGIDLGNNGITTNDVSDVDTGANQLQNYPVLTSVLSAFGSLQVQGTLNSQSGTTYRLEFFSTPSWDATGIPEGQTYLGATNATTDGGGNAAFSVSFQVALASNTVVTATAADPAGNTSEFSFASALSFGPSSVSLAIARDGNTEVVSWPSAASAFQLQAVGSLTPPVQWQTITTGIGDDGTFRSYVVTNGVGTTNQFFRLKR
jgi:parallel beta-helix repeat protein